jgi:hypothetical protein
MLQIESGVPAPKYHVREKYPFYDMRVGDSFVVLDPRVVKNARSAAWMFSRRHPGVRFATRKEGRGCRIWRVT